MNYRRLWSAAFGDLSKAMSVDAGVNRFEPERGFRFATYATGDQGLYSGYILRSWSLVKTVPRRTRKSCSFKLRSAKAKIGATGMGRLPRRVKSSDLLVLDAEGGRRIALDCIG